MYHVSTTKLEIINPVLARIVNKYLYKFNAQSNHRFNLKSEANTISHIDDDRFPADDVFFELSSYFRNEYETQDKDIYEFLKNRFITYFKTKDNNSKYASILNSFIEELENNITSINNAYKYIRETSITDTDEYGPELNHRIVYNFVDRCPKCNEPIISYFDRNEFYLVCSQKEKCCFKYDDFIYSSGMFLNTFSDLEYDSRINKITSSLNIDLPFVEEEIPGFLKRINKESNDDFKYLVEQLIFITPRTYKYFDHSIIDIEMIKYLMDNFYVNDYYKNFCTDKRFYKYLRKRNKHNIVEEISGYINLEKKGKYYIGLCPFHPDKNPSLYVLPSRGKWICRSCGKRGYAKDFIDKYESSQAVYLPEHSIMYKKNIKNTFFYYLFSNLPDNLKNNKKVIALFLEKDGCILKLVSKELKYDNKLVEIAMSNDITAFRYIMNNEELKNKYLEKYPILNYYIKKRNHTNKKKKIKRKKSKNVYDNLDDSLYIDFGQSVEVDIDELPF